MQDAPSYNYLSICSINHTMKRLHSLVAQNKLNLNRIIFMTHSQCAWLNDHTIGWQNLNLLSQHNATILQQARQARASGENLNYVTLAPQAR